MIDIEIDGKEYQAEQGSMIIEVADANHIHIPRFCYHKKLSIAANCRMCLVDVEKSGKPLPACATPVTAGMRISTKSPKAIDAQRAVMEFLLINHPLDCPICDQGGECELQDISMGYGKGISSFTEGKRVVKDKNIGPLIATDMTRCIHCTRCVRFGQEIAGLRELGATGRGEKMEIGTYVEHSVRSELSGNVIDLCPVGALTSKPFRFKARAWEMRQHASVAPHDCVGSHIYIHTLREKVMRVVPKENEAINETWISDRDRYSYTGLENDDRLTKPLVKHEGQWKETDWLTALSFAAEGLKQAIVNDPTQMGAIISPNSTVEECYLLQKILRNMGSHNIDHRLHQSDFADQDYLPFQLGLNFPFQELEKQDVILLIGSHVHREQPIVGNRLRKATLQGAHIVAINPIDFEYPFPLKEKSVIHPDHFINELTAILKGLENPDQSLTSTQKNMVALLKQGKKKTILLGALALNHPQASWLRSLTQAIAKHIEAEWGCLSEGANSAGAWMAGAIPHRKAAAVAVPTPGLNHAQMWEKELRAYILFNVEPHLDCANPALVQRSLAKANFVVAFSSYQSPLFNEHADVVLPIAAFAETSGTFVNAEGKWQSFTAAIPPKEEVRPGWKVLRAWGNLLSVPGFEYMSSEEVRDELKNLGLPLLKGVKGEFKPKPVVTHSSALTRITEWPIYRGDSVLRHADPLQKSATSDILGAYIHPKTAEKFGFKEDDWALVTQNGHAIRLPILIDVRIPDACVLIHGSFNETAVLGESFGAIEMKKLP